MKYQCLQFMLFPSSVFLPSREMSVTYWNCHLACNQPKWLNLWKKNQFGRYVLPTHRLATADHL